MGVTMRANRASTSARRFQPRSQLPSRLFSSRAKHLFSFHSFLFCLLFLSFIILAKDLVNYFATSSQHSTPPAFVPIDTDKGQIPLANAYLPFDNPPDTAVTFAESGLEKGADAFNEKLLDGVKGPVPLPPHGAPVLYPKQTGREDNPQNKPNNSYRLPVSALAVDQDFSTPGHGVEAPHLDAHQPKPYLRRAEGNTSPTDQGNASLWKGPFQPVVDPTIIMTMDAMPAIFNITPTNTTFVNEQLLPLLKNYDIREDQQFRELVEWSNLSFMEERYGPVARRGWGSVLGGDSSASPVDNLYHLRHSGDAKKGYGIYASKNIPNATILAPYSGEMVDLDTIESGQYAWLTPDMTLRDPRTGQLLNLSIVIDSTKAGNMMRFVNDLGESKHNVETLWVPVGNRWTLFYEASRDIATGEELSVSYGDDYWEGKHPSEENKPSSEGDTSETVKDFNLEGEEKEEEEEGKEKEGKEGRKEEEEVVVVDEGEEKEGKEEEVVGDEGEEEEGEEKEGKEEEEVVGDEGKEEEEVVGDEGKEEEEVVGDEGKEEEEVVGDEGKEEEEVVGDEGKEEEEVVGDEGKEEEEVVGDEGKEEEEVVGDEGKEEEEVVGDEGKEEEEVVGDEGKEEEEVVGDEGKEEEEVVGDEGKEEEGEEATNSNVRRQGNGSDARGPTEEEMDHSIQVESDVHLRKQSLVKVYLNKPALPEEVQKEHADVFGSEDQVTQSSLNQSLRPVVLRKIYLDQNKIAIQKKVAYVGSPRGDVADVSVGNPAPNQAGLQRQVSAPGFAGGAADILAGDLTPHQVSVQQESGIVQSAGDVSRVSAGDSDLDQAGLQPNVASAGIVGSAVEAPSGVVTPDQISVQHNVGSVGLAGDTTGASVGDLTSVRDMENESAPVEIAEGATQSSGGEIDRISEAIDAKRRPIVTNDGSMPLASVDGSVAAVSIPDGLQASVADVDEDIQLDLTKFADRDAAQAEVVNPIGEENSDSLTDGADGGVLQDNAPQNMGIERYAARNLQIDEEQAEGLQVATR